MHMVYMVTTNTTSWLSYVAKATQTRLFFLAHIPDAEVIIHYSSVKNALTNIRKFHIGKWYYSVETAN